MDKSGDLPAWYTPDEEVTPEMALKLHQYLARRGKVVADNWGNVCSCGYFRPQVKACTLSCEYDVCKRWECCQQRQKPSLFCSKKCEERYHEYWDEGGFLAQLDRASNTSKSVYSQGFYPDYSDEGY